MTACTSFLTLLSEVPDPRRAEGKLYKLPHVLLFSILAVITGSNSYRGIVTFIDNYRPQLNEIFRLNWRRAPAHTSIRHILKGLDPQSVEAVFRLHAAQLNDKNDSVTPVARCVALDGKTLRGSFDHFNDLSAAQVLSALATATALVLAHIDVEEQSNEIPAAQKLLSELNLKNHLVTLDALHCQKKHLRSLPKPKSSGLFSQPRGKGIRGSAGRFALHYMWQRAEPGRRAFKHDILAYEADSFRRYAVC